MEIYNDQFYRSGDEYLRAQPGDWNWNETVDGKFKYDPNNSNLGKDYSFSLQRWLRNIRDRKYRFDGPEYLAWATAHQKMFDPRNNFGEWNVQGEPYDVFLGGKVGMIASGTWALDQMKNDMVQLQATSPDSVFEWGTFENPAMTGPGIQGPVRSIESAVGVYCSIIDKNPQQTAMVVDFVNFWLSQPGYQAYLDAGIPAGYTLGGPLAIKGIKLPASVEATLGSIKMIGNAEYMGKHFESLGQIFNVPATMLTVRLVSGELTPQQYCTQLQKLIDDNFARILAEFGYTMDNIDHPERMP
jgi:ABC-type glycerol-3-phosphate transport system substrate-binding protein